MEIGGSLSKDLISYFFYISTIFVLIEIQCVFHEYYIVKTRDLNILMRKIATNFQRILIVILV